MALTWLKTLFPRQTTRAARKPAPRPTPRPTLVQLEDRVTPAAISIADAAAAEGAGTLTFTVTSDVAAGAGGITFNFDTGKGTATAGTDYVAVVAGKGAIPAGNTSTTVTVTISDDNTVELDETFIVTLSNPSVGDTIANGTAIGTIVNDDTSTVNVAPAAAAEGMGVGFAVTLSNPVDTDVTVTLTPTAGTAAASADFDPIPLAVTIPAGTLTATGTVATFDDRRVEGAEAFTATVSGILPTNVTFGTASATGTITDNDTATLSFALAASAVAEADAGATDTFVDVVLTITTTGVGIEGLDVAVDGTVTDLTSGSAASDVDYVAFPPTTVTFAPADGTAFAKAVAVGVIGDVTVEADETVNLALAVAAGPAVLGGPASHQLTILNDDATTLTVDDVTQAEGAGPMTFTVTLSNSVQGGFTVDISTADVTALASEGDYTFAGGTLVFAGTAGETKTFQVVVLNENLVEPNDESFTVSLSNVVTVDAGILAGKIDAADTANGVILNDDTATISLMSTVGAEGTNLLYTVTLSNPVSKDVSVDFSTLAGTGVRPATPGADFTIVSASKLTFAAKTQAVTIAVPIIDDRRVEGSEQFDAEVTNKATDASVDPFVTVAKAQDTATITDNDTAVFSFTQAANSRVEDDVAGVTATVQLSINAVGAGADGLDRSITVRVTSGGTATNGVDYNFASPTDLTFPGGTFTTAAQSIAFDLVEDLNTEGDETILFAIAVQADATATQAVVGAPATHTFTIINDDGAVDPGKLFAASAGAGSLPLVRLYTIDGKLSRQFLAFEPSFQGGVRVATGDVNGDGFDDIVAGAGPGGGPRVVVIDGKTGGTLASFFAFETSFTNGVFVAVGDVSGDGTADIIIGAGSLGGPRVQVRDGTDFTVLQDFFAYDASFRGGVRVAVGDVDGDEVAEIVTGAGLSGAPHVRIFGLSEDHQVVDEGGFFAFDPAYRGGVFVGVATSLSGPDIIVTGPESSPDFSGTLLELLFPTLPNADGFPAGRGPIAGELARPSEVRTFFQSEGGSFVAGPSTAGFDPNFLGGVRVAGGDPINDEPTIIIGPGSGSNGVLKRLRLTQQGGALATIDEILPFADLGAASIYVG